MVDIQVFSLRTVARGCVVFNHACSCVCAHVCTTWLQFMVSKEQPTEAWPHALEQNHCSRNAWERTKHPPRILLPVSHFLQVTPPPKGSPTSPTEPSTDIWVNSTWASVAFHIQSIISSLKLEAWFWGWHLLNCLLAAEWVIYGYFSHLKV